MSDGTVTNQTSVLAEKTAPDMKVSPVQEQADNEQQLSADKAKQVTESINTFFESANTQLRFKFHEKLNEYYVTIVDSATDEVIREIPSKKLMDIHAAMRDFVGLLVDRKV
jgi:flagellar protein FlaG